MVVVVHILNISRTKVFQNITPYGAWFHRKPNVNHLKVLGCIAYVLIDENDRVKIDKMSEKCIFIGYSNESKGYRSYN